MPNPLKCSRCGSELLFVAHREKLGKNGKMAKWPEYEKCKNPDCKVGRRTLGIAEVYEEPRWLEPDTESQPTKVASPAMRVFQLEPKREPVQQLQETLRTVVGVDPTKWGGTQVFCSTGLLDQLKEAATTYGVDLSVLPAFTPTYRYLGIVQRGANQ